MANNVNITSGGIQKVLRNYNEKQALAEYIWNGFDAKADTVEISYQANALGFIDRLEVTDNGYGINLKTLKQKFDPFYESEKAKQLPVNRSLSVMHGKNGVGRLTFFTFANDAEWQTTFLQQTALKSGSIRIGVSALNHYQAEILDQPLATATGTKVIFSNLKIAAQQLEQEVIPYLKAEFCWFLELNRKKGYTISINGVKLDYSCQIQDIADDIVWPFPGSRTVFKMKFIQWKDSLHKELSKVYYLNEKAEEVFKEYTTLNKKADEFYHSVYVESEFFTDFDFNSTEQEMQVKLYNRSKSSPEYKFLNKNISALLREKRKAFLKTYSVKLLDRYEKEGILPAAGKGKNARVKQKLQELLKVIYEIQPKLFSNLSLDQKKTMTGLMEALLISNQRARLLTVLTDIIDPDEEDQAELAGLLDQ